MIKKAYLYIFAFASLLFGVVTIVLSLFLLSSMSSSFGEVIVWAQDSLLHYNTNYNAGGHVVFMLVFFILAFLAFAVMIPILMKNKNYLLIAFLGIYFVCFILGLIPLLNFVYLDFNFGQKGLGIIDIDIFAMALGTFTIVFSLATLVMVILNMKKATFKYDPVVIRKYKN